MVVQTQCQFCQQAGGEIIWQDENLRLIHSPEPGFPAFYRVVWQAHVSEFSQLSLAQRQHCMAVVASTEQALIQILKPTKINLASLGNMVPHLHWHIIARFDWDSHFPAPVWAQAVRPQQQSKLQAVASKLEQVHAYLQQQL